MNELPNKKEIKQCYESFFDVFNEILSNIENKLKSVVKLNSKPTFKTRIKSFPSYYKKVLRLKANEAVNTSDLIVLTDMMGIRIVCAFLEDLGIVQKQIEEAFDVKEVEKKGAQQSFREFGYESLHILVAIPKECMPKDKNVKLPENTVCEIQIRTILQDAWAEVEHELIYKSEFNPFDKPLRRKLASINASLTLADMIFQEIRDYQNKLQVELGTRRNTFYEKADVLTSDNENKKTDNDFFAMSEALTESGSIDDLVLKALHEHNIGNFSKAIQIYTAIIESNPKPNNIILSVIYKHRGMAYFAQSEYDLALLDFKSSVENDPKCFRSLYYEGIVYSVKNMDKEAIEAFTDSLSIDSFQSHVYYRRGLAYYNLGDYNNSLADVKNAINLGLEDDDLLSLRAKLMKKFDMSM